MTRTTQHEAAPYYLAIGDELDIFEAAYEARLPVLLKGPTGCGKTRFVEYMTWRLYRQQESPRQLFGEPLVTVSCHEDLTATDLVGRYLLRGDEAVWMDGPLTRAVRAGSICGRWADMRQRSGFYATLRVRCRDDGPWCPRPRRSSHSDA